MTPAVWSNGARTVRGHWCYNRAPDNFTIELDSHDRITGRGRVFVVYGDTPEWGRWKREPRP